MNAEGTDPFRRDTGRARPGGQHAKSLCVVSGRRHRPCDPEDDVGHEKETATEPEANVCIVDASDQNGSVVGRDAFPTQAECDSHAAKMRAQGHKVEQSSLVPKR